MCVCVCVWLLHWPFLSSLLLEKKKKKQSIFNQALSVCLCGHVRKKKRLDNTRRKQKKKNGRQARCKEVALGDADKALLRGLTALHHFPSMCFLWLDERRAEHRLRKKESRNRAMLRVEVKG